MPTGLRRTLAAMAISAVAVAGWQLDNTIPSGLGLMGLPGATAEPTGPPGPTGDPSGANGGQFQPPGLPPQQPDYQGGISQPPLDQSNGISIYNTGAQGAPQQAGQQGPQQAEQGQQPQHGNQIPNYQTATPYTQGPGKSNPDYQDGNQAQQPQQGQQQSQAPTQTQQSQDKQEQDNPRNERDQNCNQSNAAPKDIALLGVDKLPAEVAQAVKSGMSLWQNTGMVDIKTSSKDDDSRPNVDVTSISDSSIPWGAMFVPSIDGAKAQIQINISKLSGNPAADAALIAHEIGHELGLPDTANGQIMDHSGPTRSMKVTPADINMLSQAQAGCGTSPSTYGPEYGCGWLDEVCNVATDAWDSTKDAAKDAWDSTKGFRDAAWDVGKCAFKISMIVVPAFKAIKIAAVITKMIKEAGKAKDAVKMIDAVKAFGGLFKGVLENKNTSWMDKAKEIFTLIRQFKDDHGGGEAVMKLFSSITGIGEALAACGLAEAQ